MLDELAVANLGILESTQIHPGSGLVVLTGETGAGKTLLLGALRLLLGGTARKDQIGPHGPELSVEGRFVLGDDETVAGRRVTETRGRSYLDGSMVPAKVLAAKLGETVEIVGQHDALSLTEGAVVRRLVDSMLDDAGLGGIASYADAWGHHAELLEREAALGGDLRSLEREIEVLEYQANEIDAAGFEPGEDRELRTRANRLRNAGAIAEAVGSSLESLEGERGSIDSLGEVADHLLRASRLDETLEPVAAQANSIIEAASSLVGELHRVAADLNHDGGDLDTVENRLGVLADLKRKYGDSLDSVLEFGDTARGRAVELRDLVAAAEGLTEDLEKSSARLAEAAAQVRLARQQAASLIAERTTTHLIDLGFTDPVVDFEFTDSEPAVHGGDRIALRFASDSTLKPSPVGRSASGGELSRLVLSVRLSTASQDVPVLAFDEIDAGLGGSTAIAMGAKLAALATGRQVLCVTHLPQVAAFADEHFVVDREGPTAAVRRVDGEERIAEITRMLSGLSGSESGREHAAELLETAQAAR